MNRRYLWGAAALALVAVLRIVSTYKNTWQTFDEPCHVSAAIELLQKRSYTLDPYNTPLARLSIGLPLYLAGERLPNRDPNEKWDYNTVGNKILNDNGRYSRNLTLARIGILPFFLLSAYLVFYWSRREFGNTSALLAVFLFTTLPPVLAFSSVAYSDMAPAFAQGLVLLAFVIWIETRSLKSASGLGIAIGLAVLAKFTSLIYLPAAMAAILIVKSAFAQSTSSVDRIGSSKIWLRQSAIAIFLASVVIWAGYMFSVSRLQTQMDLSPGSMPSFQHFPAVLRPLARKLVRANPAVPAPGLFGGLLLAYTFNKSAPPSYFLGSVTSGGHWYFFLADVALKTPIPALLLFGVGASYIFKCRASSWSRFAPAVSVIAILLITATVKVHYGIRHVMGVFPMLAMVAGFGAVTLWEGEGKWRTAKRVLVVGLLAWQGAASLGAQRDFMAYFNPLAGSDPSKVFVSGCDLDCGQDVLRLAMELKSRGISHPNIAIWTSADIAKAGLPEFSVPQPYQPVTGWIAISMRSLRMGDVFHESYPAGAFSWLDRYQPVAYVGKTIRLYYIPANLQAKDPRVTAGTKLIF